MVQMMMKDLREMEKELDKELPERDVEKEKQQLQCVIIVNGIVWILPIILAQESEKEKNKSQVIR